MGQSNSSLPNFYELHFHRKKMNYYVNVFILLQDLKGGIKTEEEDIKPDVKVAETFPSRQKITKKVQNNVKKEETMPVDKTKKIQKTKRPKGAPETVAVKRTRNKLLIE